MGASAETALHLGDSAENDCRPAERAGMRYLQVPSVRELAERAGVSLPSPAEDLPERSALAERILLGCWAESCFGSLFGPDGRDAVLRRYGAAAIAPVMIVWVLWLLSKAAEHGAEGILFTARDGWLPYMIFEKLGLEAFTAGYYFYTSRRAAFLLSSGSEESAGYIASMAAGMDPDEVLRRFYGIADGAEPSRPETRSAEDLKQIILKNSGAAAAVSQKALCAAEKYWKKLGLIPGKTYIYSDFVASGTSQRLLEEAAPFLLEGCYFGRPLSGFAETCSAQSMLEGSTGPEKELLERYIGMEYYMTSSEPSLESFEGEGTPVFAAETRSENELKEIEAVHRAALDLTERFIGISLWDQLKEDDVNRLSAAFSPEKLASMALAASFDLPERRYYDDWSGRWING